MSVLRHNAWTGGSMLATAPPGQDPDPAPPADPEPQVEPEEPAGDEGDGDPEPQGQTPPRSRPAPAVSVPRVPADLATWALAVLTWCWVALPLVQGGPERVAAVWRAKWLNKGPDGEELP